MTKGFTLAVRGAFTAYRAKWLVLGDSTHGEKSLKSLAAAVKAGQIDLPELGVTTVLIEGPTKGQEEAFENGAYAAAVRIIKAKKIIVRGCETRVTLSSGGEMEKLPTDDPVVYSAAKSALLDRRITDANDSWIKQVQDCKPNVIICVGTSHLARMRTPNATDLGLIVRLGFKGSCIGYAVEDANNDGGTYTPEKGTGSFDSIEAIAAYTGWEAIV